MAFHAEEHHNIGIMAKKTAALLPATAELLHQFGGRLRLARLRRRLAAKQVAERAGMAPMTLRSLERGGSGVTMGAYLAVMQVLGIEKDLALLGKADPVGRDLQDARLPSRPVREALPATPSVALRATAALPNALRETKKRPQASAGTQEWIQKSGFSSADTLAELIVPLARKKNAR